jgi:hypothetical protein
MWRSETHSTPLFRIVRRVLDHPVVKAAQRALDTRNLSQVLIWVQADDEPEIRAAFEHTLVVRALSPQGKELTGRYFFETVVRVHRAGEGASYTGLKRALSERVVCGGNRGAEIAAGLPSETIRRHWSTNSSHRIVLS